MVCRGGGLIAATADMRRIYRISFNASRAVKSFGRGRRGSDETRRLACLQKAPGEARKRRRPSSMGDDGCVTKFPARGPNIKPVGGTELFDQETRELRLSSERQDAVGEFRLLSQRYMPREAKSCVAPAEAEPAASKRSTKVQSGTGSPCETKNGFPEMGAPGASLSAASRCASAALST